MILYDLVVIWLFGATKPGEKTTLISSKCIEPSSECMKGCKRTYKVLKDQKYYFCEECSKNQKQSTWLCGTCKDNIGIDVCYNCDSYFEVKAVGSLQKAELGCAISN